MFVSLRVYVAFRLRLKNRIFVVDFRVILTDSALLVLFFTDFEKAVIW